MVYASLGRASPHLWFLLSYCSQGVRLRHELRASVARFASLGVHSTGPAILLRGRVRDGRKGLV